MSIISVVLPVQGAAPSLPVSGQDNLIIGFSTGSCFLWLHDRNVELGMNIRGMVNYEYNRLLAENGLSPHSIPGGENLEELGMDKTTLIVRPNLYLDACQKAMSDFTNSPFRGLNLSTATFFELLHQENMKYSANVRGLVNQRYNQLLSEAGICEGKIPGDHLEQLGMDDRTSLRADLYGRAYAQVIANFEIAASYSHCGPLQLLDNFQCIAQFLGYADILRAGQVCKLWNAFSENPVFWQNCFIEEGIPFVESVNGQPRDYKQDFKILYPMTISLKMSEELFGNVPREMPLISNVIFQKCFQHDLFEPENVMKNTFMFVVLPDFFKRTADDEFPFVLDKDGNLNEPLESDEWGGKTLQIPNTIRNLKVLCEHPLTGKKNMPVFDYFDPEVLLQCKTRPNKISVLFMRRCIADETFGQDYDSFQKRLVEDRGFKVTSLGVRIFFDAVCILTSGTCPDSTANFWSYARTSDFVVKNNNAYRSDIGGFTPGSGILVNRHNLCRARIGVVPGISADVPR